MTPPDAPSPPASPAPGPNETAHAAASPQVFPSFDPIHMRLPIVASEKTIWPAPSESKWDWVVGFPLELHPFAWDYLWISCDGYRVEIEPHYSESTWDTFWTSGTGRVTAQAFGGLFPFTLGNQVDLLRGIVATLEALPPLIESSNPDDAAKIQQIHGLLKAHGLWNAAGPDPAEGMNRARRFLSDALWRWKLKRLDPTSASGGSSNL